MRFFNFISNLSTKKLMALNLVVDFFSLLLFVWLALPLNPQSAGQEAGIIKRTTSQAEKTKASFLPFPSPSPSLLPSPLPSPSPSPPAEPFKITIPKLNVAANITKVGFIEESGKMEVPQNAMEVGWYQYGPPPGEPGAAVLTGHYDTLTGAPAIFYSLGNLASGDDFYITNEQGEQLKYVVEEIKNLPLYNFPKDLIYGERDFSQVSLLTCAGVWNPSARLYSHRLAVIAKEDPFYKKTDYLVKIPSEQQLVEQFVIQGFEKDERERQEELAGVYLRLEAKQGKISLFAASDNREVIAIDAVLEYNPEALEIDTSTVAFGNHFSAYNIQKVNNNHVVQLSLFTNPFWQTKEPFNSGNKEVKIAELYYGVKDSGLGQTRVGLVAKDKAIFSKVLKLAPGKEVHQAEDILNIAQGVVVSF